LRETAGYGLIEYYDATTKKLDDVIKDNKDRNDNCKRSYFYWGFFI